MVFLCLNFLCMSNLSLHLLIVFWKLRIINLLINTAIFKQLVMGSDPGHLAIVQNNDLVCVPDTGSPLGYNKYSPLIINKKCLESCNGI